MIFGLLLGIGASGCQLVFGDFEFVTTDGSAGSTATAECNAGQRQCAAEQPQECVDGRWVNSGDACQSGCDKNRGACLKCVSGQRRCNTDANQLEECAQDEWVVYKDCSGSMCDPNKLDDCVKCRQGTDRCTPDGDMEHCNGDLSGYTTDTCKYKQYGGCILDGDVAHCAVCFPGDTICFGPDLIGTCSAARTWIQKACTCFNLSSGAVCGS